MKQIKILQFQRVPLYKSILKRVAAFTMLVAAFFLIAYLGYIYFMRNTLREALNYYTVLRLLTMVLEQMNGVIFILVFIWIIGTLIIGCISFLKREAIINTPPEHIENKELLQKNIMQKYQSIFITSAGMYTLVLMLAAAVIYLLRKSRTWYADDPLFPLLNFLNNVSPFFAVAIWVSGIAFLLYHQWRQSASDVVGLIGSIEEMQSEKDELIIEVPEGLMEVQPIIQEIYDKKQESRRIAKEAEQRKNELIAYLAHDLKTPLTSVIGYISYMAERPDMAEEKRAEYCRIALDKATRLQSLIGEFFEISRYNMSDMVLEIEEIDLKYLLIQLADEFYPLLEPQGKSFELSLPDDMRVYGDADKLARVFNNILRNATAYSFPSTPIKISAARYEAGVRVTITNQGNTIPAEQLQNIFRKFFRLDDARSSDTGGAGLGLAIASEIVILHGGEITAESSDNVITFTVSLPNNKA